MGGDKTLLVNCVVPCDHTVLLNCMVLVWRSICDTRGGVSSKVWGAHGKDDGWVGKRLFGCAYF